MLHFDKIESDESIARLIDIVESVEDYSLQDRLAAVESLGATQSIKALDYLLLLWTNDGPVREIVRHYGGPEGVTGTDYELHAPSFPNAKDKDLQHHLGVDMVNYRPYQMMNNYFVLDYRSMILGGRSNEAEKKLNRIDDDSQKCRMRHLHSELVRMERKNREDAIQYYLAFYEMLDSQYRKMFIKKGNTYLVLDSAIRTVATQLARSGVEEVTAKLIDIAEAGVKFTKPSEVRYRNEKGPHWWSMKKKVPYTVTTRECYDLHDQLIAIEALGATKNEDVLGYLQKLLEPKKISGSYNSAWTEFPNAKNMLNKELRIGLRSIDTLTLHNRGIFIEACA